ncbi:MAG: Hpt domain-containing protein [Bdellovibrionota bacterium]
MSMDSGNFYDPILADLIPTYIAIQKQTIAQLTEALIGSDFQTIQDLAHRIKGSAACYGFKPYGDLAARLEEVSKQKEIQTCRDIFALMRKEFPQGFA